MNIIRITKCLDFTNLANTADNIKTSISENTY